MPGLPDDAGDHGDDHDQSADVERGAAQHLAGARHQDADTEHGPDTGDHPLGLEGNGGRHARGDQQPVLAGSHPPDQQVDDQRLQRDVEGEGDQLDLVEGQR